MAYIRLIDPDEAQGPLRATFEAGRSRAGKVANIMHVMGLDGPSCAASMAFYVSLMKRDNALDAATRELLAAVVSCVNDCFY